VIVNGIEDGLGDLLSDSIGLNVIIMVYWKTEAQELTQKDRACEQLKIQKHLLNDTEDVVRTAKSDRLKAIHPGTSF
jgi:hypothetical protein